jgi:hypothetical protein
MTVNHSDHRWTLRLTDQKPNVEEVRRIRHDVAIGSSQVDLAHQYGVSQQVISHIAAGRAFPDVNGPLIGAKRAPAPPLTKVPVEDIRDRVHDGQARATPCRSSERSSRVHCAS